MIGIGLAERVYGLVPTSAIREVVSAHPLLTEWDLTRRGWRKCEGVWTDGEDALRVYDTPQPTPTISAMRWTYDGSELKCLDPEHANKIRIDGVDLAFLRMCLADEDEGWKYVDPLWLRSLVRLARVLPLAVDDVDVDALYALYARCVSQLNT